MTWEDEHFGPGWKVDLLRQAADIDAWIERLLAFLREWGVPDDTALALTTYAQDRSFVAHRRVELDRSFGALSERET